MAAEPPFTEALVLPANIGHNIGVLAFNRIFASLIAGLALGVVGYTGWSGFLWYIVAQLVMGVLLKQKTGADTKPYFQSQWAVHTNEVFSSTSLLTFVLFWTLGFSCIHLF